ncbi:hypothetical protein QC763_0059640 [Podospora pseudopauciseta]|uniref:Uncharacterized protein n=1 Tax=Podospora pseudopauciseta TaxID=2093780 RepID=A0ABR0HIF9_9PEZI|nr:hypothetical protein QC763_0059640 [Podospora pseudopauciseta]
MPTRYIAEIDQSKEDRDKLRENQYLLQVAKAVATGDKPEFNVVYASKILAPHMNVQWTTKYGLNWATDMPAPGSEVMYSGTWQQCELGSSYTLDQDGDWSAKQENPHAKPDSLNVASNDYAVGVHIPVGVRDPTSKKWTPIWFGKNMLLTGTHGEYQPIETVNIWYQEGQRTATMISDQSTSVQPYEMPPSRPVYFSYDAIKGKWRTPQDQPFEFP